MFSWQTSSGLVISSSDCSVLLLCSVWWREESVFQEKELDSMSNISALPSLSHKLISVACSGGEVFISMLYSSKLKVKHSPLINKKQIFFYAHSKDRKSHVLHLMPKSILRITSSILVCDQPSCFIIDSNRCRDISHVAWRMHVSTGLKNQN